MREMIESPERGETPADQPQRNELSLTLVPKDLYYVERALVARQAAEIVALRADRDKWKKIAFESMPSMD